MKKPRKSITTEQDAIDFIQNCKTSEGIMNFLNQVDATFTLVFCFALNHFKSLGLLEYGVEVVKKLNRNLTPEELDGFVESALRRHHPKWNVGIRALKLGATTKSVELALLVSLSTVEKLYLTEFVELAMEFELSSKVSEKLVEHFLSKGNMLSAQHFADKNKRKLTADEFDKVVTYAMRTCNTELAQQALDAGASDSSLKKYVRWLSEKT